MKKIIVLLVYFVIVFSSFAYFRHLLVEEQVKLAEKKYRNEIYRNVDSIGNDLLFLMNDIRGELSFISTLFSEGYDFPISKFMLLFHNIYRNNSYIINLWKINREGILTEIAPTEFRKMIGTDYSIRPYFVNIKNKKVNSVANSLCVDYSNLDDINNRYGALVMAIPILNGNIFNGIIGCDVSLRKLGDRFQKFHIENSRGISGVYLYSRLKKNTVLGPARFNNKYDDFINTLPVTNMETAADIKIINYKNSKYFLVTKVFDKSPYNFNLSAIFPYRIIINKQVGFDAIYYLMFILLIVGVLIVAIYEKINIKLRKKIQELNIIIDQQEKRKSVNDVVDADYFKDLIRKSENMKKK